ncbi:hypothetical protein [Streptomyces sp. Rer75]|uniref:hypothetical protein n=1 Tax=Streptomyces sp. Rer75 TaxID=2750011 RepID=UPI0015D0B351|nr:hypothetical protein [Streptomyces sp. Rer75]QLH22620.1 hypothetical protein HYQ63_20050 [Streptomyces sp. Rer75]
MSVTQQYALDLYRAAQRGEPAPPAPGRDDWRTLRALREYRDFQAVIEERPARRRGSALRRALRAVRARAVQAVRPARPVRAAGEWPTGAARQPAAGSVAGPGGDASCRPVTDPSSCPTTG